MFVEDRPTELPVNRATAREEKTWYTRLLRQTSKPDGRLAVNGTSEGRIEVAHRIIRDGSEVHDAIVAGDLLERDVAHVLDELMFRLAVLLPVAAGEQVEVASGDL